MEKILFIVFEHVYYQTKHILMLIMYNYIINDKLYKKKVNIIFK